MKFENLRIINNRRREYAAAELLIYVFYLSRSVILPFWGNIKDTYIALAIPVLLSFYLYFRRLRDARELRLLALYWLWYVISRFLCRPNTIIYSLMHYMDMSLMVTFCSVGFVLDKEERRFYFDCLTAVVCGFFFVLGCAGVYTSITRLPVSVPYTGQVISYLQGSASAYSALNLLETHSTAMASWYVMCFSMMLVQFFRCRNKLWRIPICLAAFVFYLTVDFSHCRNAMASVSGCIAMLVILLVLRGGRIRGKARKIAAVVLISLIVVPLSYKSFSVVSNITGHVSEMISLSKQSAEQPAPPAEEVPSDENSPIPEVPPATPQVSVSAEAFVDPRDLGNSVKTLSNRLPIFGSAFITLARDPIRMLRGSLDEDLMTISNSVTVRPYVHFHNAYLQVLVLTGIPGFVLVMAFCYILVKRMLQIFFSEDSRVDFDIKVMTLPITGALAYCMLEIMIFTTVYLGSLLFYLLCGFFLAESHELFPEEKLFVRKKQKT